MSCPLCIHFTCGLPGRRRVKQLSAICRVPEAKKAEGFSNCDMTKKLIFPCSLRVQGYSACRLRQKPFSTSHAPCGWMRRHIELQQIPSVWKMGTALKLQNLRNQPNILNRPRTNSCVRGASFWRTSR